jgi:hypothetical protein
VLSWEMRLTGVASGHSAQIAFSPARLPHFRSS